MQIRLEVKSHNPFIGAISPEAAEPTEFDGWLDFLRLLSKLLEERTVLSEKHEKREAADET
jgi:hypothetical protein